MRNHHIDLNQNASPSLFSRRSFIQTAFGGALALGLAGCDQIEDGFTIYDGPEITEQDFISFNAQYYSAGIEARTQFPHTSIVGGTVSGVSDPVTLAYRLQYLIDNNDSASVETVLNGLLIAQDNPFTFIDYRGFIPNLAFTNNSAGFQRPAPEFKIADNAVLSARVAMAASAFAGTAIEDKAMTFLANQKEGYNFYLNGSESLFLPANGSATVNTVSGPYIDVFFGDYYVELAFVLSYFIGDSSTIQDSQVGLDAWQALTSGAAIPTGQHGDSATSLINIPVPLAKNGSGYQFFQPLLAIPTASIGAGLSDALYNALYSFLDKSRFDRLPGIYSGGPNAQGLFQANNGLSRLATADTQSVVQETFATVDALAAAMRLFTEEEIPNDVTNREATPRQTLRRWIGVYDAVPGVRAADGLYGSVDKDGNVAQAMLARQNAAMILMNSTAPGHLENFLADNGKTTLKDMFASVSFTVEGAPLTRVNKPLPQPPPQAPAVVTV